VQPPVGRGPFRTATLGGTADDGVTELAAEAYLYGFPLVFTLEQVERSVTSGVGAFRPVLRRYEPAAEVLNQTCTVPSMTRI
jgi:hypothetical protein